MTSELLRKAKDIAAAATASGALVPLDTSLTHLIGEHGISFELRHLISATPKHLRAAGPKPNPFRPWDRRLEVEQINDTHVVILNKFPVQAGHMLLITQAWQPQTGWLSVEDWRALAQIDETTTGLWFFNSGPDAGASQPHRHLQLLPRAAGEPICARQDWFQNCAMAQRSADDPCGAVGLCRSDQIQPVTSSPGLSVFGSRPWDPRAGRRPRGAYNLCSREIDGHGSTAKRRNPRFQRQCPRFRRSLLSTEASDRESIERQPEAPLTRLLRLVSERPGSNLALAFSNWPMMKSRYS